MLLFPAFYTAGNVGYKRPRHKNLRAKVKSQRIFYQSRKKNVKKKTETDLIHNVVSINGLFSYNTKEQLQGGQSLPLPPPLRKKRIYMFHLVTFFADLDIRHHSWAPRYHPLSCRRGWKAPCSCCRCYHLSHTPG